MRSEELFKEAELYKAPGYAYIHIELTAADTDNAKCDIVYAGEDASLITAAFTFIERLAIDQAADEEGHAPVREVFRNISNMLKCFRRVYRLHRKVLRRNK